ncbi:MAG TPA: NosD domain-containing protein [Propionibacteriaceae bacterium]
MAIAFAAVPAVAAVATPITECGQPLPENGYLAQDLFCEKGFVLRPTLDPDEPITAHVDLRGHRLSGISPAATSAFTVEGAAAPVHLTVSNGRIDNWGLAIAVGSAAFTATDIRADHNRQVLDCEGDCTISDSSLTANTIGVTSHEARLEMTRNAISANVVGVRTVGAVSSAYLSNNMFTSNDVGVDITSESYVELTSNTFRQNDVGVTSHVPEEAGEVYFASLSRNTFVLNRDGIRLPAGQGGSQLEQNVAVRNSNYGFYAPGATDGGGNKAAANGRACVGVTCTRPSLRESPAFKEGSRRTPVAPS